MIKKESDIIKESPQTEVSILKIQAYIETAEKNAALYEEKDFEKCVEVIDFIGFQVLDHIEVLLHFLAQVLAHRHVKWTDLCCRSPSQATTVPITLRLALSSWLV